MEDEDFLAPISLEEFDERTNHAYWPITPFSAAQEHWPINAASCLASSRSIRSTTTIAT